jgi:hypothetical protein
MDGIDMDNGKKRNGKMWKWPGIDVDSGLE